MGKAPYSGPAWNMENTTEINVPFNPESGPIYFSNFFLGIHASSRPTKMNTIGINEIISTNIFKKVFDVLIPNVKL